jgi:membrane protease YdiL (CAAX protease family)
MAGAVVLAAAADRFVDLARLGRTDAWSGVRGAASIVGWYLLAAVAYYTVGRAVHLPLGGSVADIVELLAIAAGFGLGVRSAVTFCQGRPFGSLFGPDLRLRPRRVATGAGLWLAGLAAGIAVVAAIDTLSGGPAAAGPPVATGAPPWGQSALLLAAGAVAFPLQSGAEELVFRGWLTQTLGQLVRPRLQLAALVGMLFAAAHIPHGGPAFLALVVTSVGFSLLSLFDGRLELAIGAHAAHNLMLAVAGIVLERSDHLFTRYHAVGWSAVVFALVQGTVAVLLARLILRPADAPGALPEAPSDRNRPPAAPLRGFKGWRIRTMARQGGGDQGPKDGGMRGAPTAEPDDGVVAAGVGGSTGTAVAAAGAQGKSAAGGPNQDVGAMAGGATGPSSGAGGLGTGEGGALGGTIGDSTGGLGSGAAAGGTMGGGTGGSLPGGAPPGHGYGTKDRTGGSNVAADWRT